MATSCEWIRNMSAIGLKSRSGRVVTWTENINGRWVDKRALVDTKCDNEIVSPVDTLRLHDSLQNDDWIRDNRTRGNTQPLEYKLFGVLPVNRQKFTLVSEPGETVQKA